MSPERLVIAVPKGRILEEALPIIRAAGIEPEAAFGEESSRKLMFDTNQPGISLIRVRSFDVATFVAFGGAQELYGTRPDLTTLGKVIGGGMPLAAFGGPKAIMSQLAPTGPVYQAGTLSGNPVATACGLATLREIAKPGFWDALSARTQSLVDGLKSKAQHAGVPFCADCQGGMFGFFLRAFSFFAATSMSAAWTNDGSRCSALRTVCVAIESKLGMNPPVLVGGIVAEASARRPRRWPR